VEGEKNVDFLAKRHQVMSGLAHFKGMLYSKEHDKIKEWIPLMMEGRPSEEAVAATYFKEGHDINFGEITDQLFDYLSKQNNVDLFFESEVMELEQVEEKRWLLAVSNEQGGPNWKILCNHVFIGAGGGALPLLDKSEIEEGAGYGGFPISGLFLRCVNPKIIEQHNAKVYGKAKEGSPPMSVPHLDSRIINGQKELLFGPFAGFSTKFLKHGSYFDLPKSIEFDNILSLLGAGYHNLPLVVYLLKQISLSFEDRMEMLQEFYPRAKNEYWKLVVARQRVQIIKRDEEDLGKLQFGTEIILSEDKTLSALLGASPGASTSYAIMKELFNQCF